MSHCNPSILIQFNKNYVFHNNVFQWSVLVSTCCVVCLKWFPVFACASLLLRQFCWRTYSLTLRTPTGEKSLVSSDLSPHTATLHTCIKHYHLYTTLTCTTQRHYTLALNTYMHITATLYTYIKHLHAQHSNIIHLHKTLRCTTHRHYTLT